MLPAYSRMRREASESRQGWEDFAKTESEGRFFDHFTKNCRITTRDSELSSGKILEAREDGMIYIPKTWN